MGRKLSRWLREGSTSWVALLGLLIFVIFLVWVLPNQAADAELARGDAPSPDTSFFYSPQDLYQMAGSYGPDGRSAYIRERFTFDLIWPAAYMFFLTTAISWSYARLFPPHSWLQRLNLVPLLAGLLDYLENLATSAVMWRFPDRIPLVPGLAPLFTLGKWVMIGGGFALLAAAGVVWIWRSLGYFGSKINTLL